MLKSFQILCFAISFVALTAIAAAAPFVCGDADASGDVDIDDVVYLINYIFSGGPEPDPYESGDADASGGVDIDDVVYLINYIFAGGPEPYCAQYTIPSTTTIIPQEDATAIQDYDTSSGTITLDESSVYAQGIEVGDIAIGQDDSIAPYGFLRKVTSKTTQGNSIILETDTATMMEAFESMYIVETHPLLPSDVESFRLHNGTSFTSDRDGETFVVDLHCVLYDQDFDPGTTDDQIRLDGEYTFTAALFAVIEMDWIWLKKFEAGIETEQDVNIDLTANLQWEFDEAEFDLAEFHFGAIPIGGVVWLVPTLTVEAHIHGDLTVTFETGITYTQELRYGLGWANDAFYDINESTEDFAYTPPQLTAAFNFEPGVSLNASCLLYGVAGPYMAGKAGLHFESVLSADSCGGLLTFDLEAILYAVVGIECDILDLDYNSQFELYTHLIGEWIYPLGGFGTIVIDPDPDNINAPWFSAGPCSYNTNGNGDDSLTSMYPGDYTVTWGNVSGWTAPSSSTQTLAADDTLTFSGIYVEDDSTGTVTDIDGNVYQTIKIGDQWWMMENLKVTHYRNGDSIPNVTDPSTWYGLSTGAYCNYLNDEGNVATYGRLYNWYAVDDSRSIAPEGWHVPTDAEWKDLEMYLGMSQEEADASGWRGTGEGGKLKEAGTTHWFPPNNGATNESGFTGLPGGHCNQGGYFWESHTLASFWSSTYFYDDLVYSRSLGYNISLVSRDYSYRQAGYSVRCIKD